MTYQIKEQELLNRFIAYAKENTRSNEANADQVPSSPNQVAFAKKLVEELTTLGFSDVSYNKKDSFVTATIPATDDSKNYPTIGFFAHVDTADFNAENVQPQIIENYDGSVIPLGDSGYVLDPDEFDSLNKYVGQTLITTDGTTLLGADDKAGIAEIVTAGKYLIDHPEIKHGEVKVAFGPDEEIGVGADRFDVEGFAADFAYTMDGGPLGELEFETFHAASAVIEVAGKNIHPGSAKDLMINALQVAIDIHNQLPENERPENTEGREGFFHLMGMDGNVEAAKSTYIIRDHDRQQFENRKAAIQAAADNLNEFYGRKIATVTLNDQYYNMGEIIEKDMRPVTLAENAFAAVNIQPDIIAVRGGTDGSKLTYMGLPTPNLFAGGENMHGRFEYVSLQTMVKATEVILAIVEGAGDYDRL
ncbi:peptidase T [Aerococcus urinaeequi]|uniref:Peptidase T n=1 Tax=Aerococcus viridans TaxID=1377 RepID=A0A2N6UFV8_9LACT|nr:MULTISPECIES: peptidase T [Aerococcus]OFU48143.1 peptidase T [Aerococcus sp. HMSC10H05]PMC80425.1 peptidase T [Aerococcus viridans]